MDNMDRDTKRNERTARRRKQLRARVFLLILLSVLGSAAAILLILRFTPTSRRMSYEEYFGPVKENEAAIVLQDQILTDQHALISESGAVYLPHSLVRDSLNERFFWDEENAQFLFTTALQTLRSPLDLILIR